MNKPHRLPAILLIVVATFAIYWPSLRNGFVWDDTALVLRDPFLRSWRLIPDGFRHFLFTDATPSNFYRPMQRLTYTLDYQLFAFQPWGWHLANIVLHAAAGVMLFLLAGELARQFKKADTSSRFEQGGKRIETAATLAALAWVVHPVHTAAVCYVSGRADLLAALFGFAGLFFALKSGDEKARPWLRVVPALCFLAAMLSKESGAMFLVIALLMAAVLGGKPAGDGAVRTTGMLAILAFLARLCPALLTALAVLAVYLPLRFTAEKLAPPPPKRVPAAVRPILFARAVAEYAGLLAAPVKLHMERELIAAGGDLKKTLMAANRREYQTLLGLALIAVFIAGCLRARRRDRLVFFCLLAGTAAYLPVSNLMPLNANTAEHWLYVPCAFWFLAAAAAVSHARFAKTAAIFAVLWIAALGARTFARNADWKNPRTFYEATIRDGGDSARMFIGLGIVESGEGRHDAAIAALDEAIKREPDNPFALLNLANAYTRKRDFVRARELLEKAQKHGLVRGDAIVALAVTDYQENKRDRTDLLRAAAENAPHDWEVRRRYILHLAERHQIGDAMQETRRVLEKQPWRAESWRLLGWLLWQTGARDAARTAYQQAADYDVHDAESREKLKLLSGKNANAEH